MRLLRIGARGGERPAVLVEERIAFDLSPITDDIDGPFLEYGLDRVAAAIDAGALDELALTDQRIGPPLGRIGKIVCVGLNYADHAAETGQSPPEPVLFLKAADTIVGPTDTVLIPRTSVRTDYEIELAVIIGRTARYLDSPAASAAVIAGYAIANDVSERDFQNHRGGQWDKGKNCETFCPLGPWLVTADEIADPRSLALRLWLNGDLRQDSTTAQMIFGVDHLIWYISQFMVLHPGDVINTGTPAGVALGRADGGYLRAGDVVRAEIDRLGHQQQTFGGGMSTGDYSGLRLLVTGGGSGIGAAIAAAAIDRGATVAVLDLDPAGAPAGAVPVAADVIDDDSVAGAVATAAARLGGLDILVNNAGIGAQGTIETNPLDEWRRVFDVNVLGIVRVTRAALPHLRASHHAAIVNTCSIAATAGLPERALYSATKGAVLSLTLAMAADHLHEGIRVNCVNPGTTDTPWIGRLLDTATDPTAERAALEARQPTGRLVTADEVAAAVLYLAGPHAGATTGTSLAVDGGMAGLRLRPTH